MVVASTPPKPYTPVEATGATFGCIGRSTTLGTLLFPEQIKAAGKPLLSSPVRMVMEPDILTTMTGVSRILQNDGETAAWTWQGDSSDLSVSSTMTGHCDGFSWYEVELRPKRPFFLNSLSLEIPRVASTARYLHTANYTWSNLSQGLPELGGKWSGAFLPYIWLGDEERGLAWCAESNEGFRLNDPARTLTIETKNDTVLFRTHIIDHAETITTPLLLRFGLQASPVKPISPEWRANVRILHDFKYDPSIKGPDGRLELDRLKEGGVKTIVIHDLWTKYFGQMMPDNPAQLRQLVEACHQRDMKLLVYTGYGIARTAPEMQGTHDQWSVIPLIPWDPGYKPELRGFDATCSRGGWADWLVNRIDKLFTEFDLDGLYIDGTSAAWICSNQLHGCGWKDANGNVHGHHPIRDARRLMRRIADTVHRHNPEAILDAHMSSNLTLPTLAFCDSLWNGEQFEVHKAGDNFEVPLHVFRTEFMGYAHGFDMEFLCYEKKPFTFPESIALAWLHGVEVRPYPHNLFHVTPIWRALDDFGTTSSRWLPYWSQTAAVSDNPSVKVSAWTRDDKALLFVSHLKRNNESAEITIDPARLGIEGNTITVTDVLTTAPVAFQDKTIKLSFEGMTYRMLKVGVK